MAGGTVWFDERERSTLKVVGSQRLKWIIFKTIYLFILYIHKVLGWGAFTKWISFPLTTAKNNKTPPPYKE